MAASSARIYALAHTASEPHLAERLLAGVVLAASSPIVLGAAIAVRILSGRCPFVAHRRVGLWGDEFWMLKLRTMWPSNAGRPSTALLTERLEGVYVPKAKGATDERITSRFARTLRKYSIDELPQLLHVLTGRMAIVGPRPVTRPELEAHYGALAREVLQVRPGITGLWQVLGRNRLTYPQRRRLDVFYIRRRCWSLDVAILLKTVSAVLTGRDAW
jgi:lipopolysaccharide/colanic/teichoic acid biosynthesis glycosyltransferase